MRILVICLLWAGACINATAQTSPAAKTTPIKHVIIIMQENRSFDSYFGTYPKANGIPAGTCVPLNTAMPDQGCVMPFHDVHDVNAGGPHSAPNAQNDLDDGIKTYKLDGFVQSQKLAKRKCSPVDCGGVTDGTNRHDVMGYHDSGEIPNYWAYAQHFVLQDAMFEGVRSWSWPSHIDMTSEWVAKCTKPGVLATCETNNRLGYPDANTVLPWVNLFQLMDLHSVSWRYYLDIGDQPDCMDEEAMDCPPAPQYPTLPSYWNPAPFYTSVMAQGPDYLSQHNPPLAQFYTDIQNNALPQVSWIIPSNPYSEHPPSGVTAGMEYVTALINAIAASPYWNSTAIFLSWDDWGGLYDHVAPPTVDTNSDANPVQGFGLRVPGLLISAYAKAGRIDHNVLSTDSYATFIEDIFMGGARLDPAALGQPDARPTIRDALTSVTMPDGTTAKIGNLLDEFDFHQTPIPPLILSTHIPTSIYINCRSAQTDHEETCTSPTVTISWNAVTSADVPGPFTYHVTRDGRDLPSCTGTTTSCTDVPSTGAHIYRAYTVDSHGVASPPSAGAEADAP